MTFHRSSGISPSHCPADRSAGAFFVYSALFRDSTMSIFRIFR